MKFCQIIVLFAFLLISLNLTSQECYNCLGVNAVLDVNGNATLIVDGLVTFANCDDTVQASYSNSDPAMNTITINCNDINPANGGFVYLPIYMYVNGVIVNDQINCLSNGLAFVIFNNYQDICCPNEGDCIVVPVEWISFSGEANEDANKLVWLVNEDAQVDFYEIQRRSEFGSEFETISVFTNIQKSENASYEYFDETCESGIRYYYRLQQFDLDGNFSFSNVISLKTLASNNAELEIFPNPAHEYLEISLQIPTDADVELTLFDVSGIKIETGALNIPQILNEGGRSITANIESLNPGVYTLLLDAGGEQIVKRFMKI